MGTSGSALRGALKLRVLLGRGALEGGCRPGVLSEETGRSVRFSKSAIRSRYEENAETTEGPSDPPGKRKAYTALLQ